MHFRPGIHGPLVLLAFALALNACQVAPPKVSDDVGVIVRVRAGTHTFRFVGVKGQALGDFSVLVGGQIFHAKGGVLNLPDSVAGSSAGMTILAQGYAPLVISSNANDTTLPLTALVPGTSTVIGTRALNNVSTALAAANNTATVLLGAGFVAKAGSVVTVSSYTPAIGASSSDFTLQRTNLLAKINGANATCDAPLPCQAASAGLGLLVAVDGALGQGKLSVTYDLAALAKGTPDQQAAAAQIQKVFAAFDATGNPAYRAQLQTAYGISLANGQLTFEVPLDDKARTDGAAKVSIGGFAALGLALEVTVVSSSGGAGLPAEVLGSRPLTTAMAGNFAGGGVADPRGNPLRNQASDVISNQGAAVISNQGAAVISNHGADFIPYNGGQVISNNGGVLLGTALSPLRGDIAKYALMAFQEWPLTGVVVKAVDPNDVPYGQAVSDNAGAFHISGLPATPQALLFLASDARSTLRAIAAAPRGGTLSVTLDAASKGVTDLVLTQLRAGRGTMADVDLAGFNDDALKIRQLLDQTTANAIVTASTSSGAAMTRAIMSNAGYVPHVLPASALVVAGSPSPLPSTPASPVPSDGPGNSPTPKPSQPVPSASVAASPSATPTPRPSGENSGSEAECTDISPSDIQLATHVTVIGHGFGRAAGTIEYVTSNLNGTIGPLNWSDGAIEFVVTGALATAQAGSSITVKIRMPDGSLLETPRELVFTIPHVAITAPPNN